MKEEIKLFIWLGLLCLFLLLYYFFIQKCFKDNNEKVFMLILIIALFFCPPIVWYAISIKGSLGFIYPEHIDAWIGFYGAIIGGALTLFGVWWTISDQGKKRRNDLSIEYKPTLSIHSDSTIKHKPSFTVEEVFSPNFNDEFNIGGNMGRHFSDEVIGRIKLINSGRGEITRLNIYINHYTAHIKCYLQETYYNIFPNDTIEFEFIAELKDFKEKSNTNFEESFNIFLEIYDLIEHKVINSICITIKKDVPIYCGDGDPVDESNYLDLDLSNINKKPNQKINIKIPFKNQKKDKDQEG